jgi:hypothetical protein
MKYAINCRTQSEFNKVLKRFDEMGRVWSDGSKLLTGEEIWDINQEKTCLTDEDVPGHCYKEFFEEEGYKIIPASEYLGKWKQGDILVDEYGDEIKILGVCGEVYLVSDYNKFDIVESFQTKTQLKAWKLKTTEEMTITEAEKTLKELGRDVKIIKE